MIKKILYVLIPLLFLVLFFSFLLNYKKTSINDSLYKIEVYTDMETKNGYGLLYKISDKGYIITNYHIIKDFISITVSNDVKVEAKLVNYDKYSDIAIISIDRKYAKEIIKTSNKYKDLYTINNNNKKEKIPLKYIDNSKVVIDLETEKFIVDCYKFEGDITYGNSGGPIFNEKQKVVGIVFTKDDKYGYGIDINKAIDIALKLEKGNIVYPDLGVNLKDENGVIVTSSNGDFSVSDNIIEIDNKKIRNIMELKYYLHKKTMGEEVKFTIERKNKIIEKTIILNQS